MNYFFSFGAVLQASHLFIFNYLYALLFSADDFSNFSHWVAQIHKSLVKVFVLQTEVHQVKEGQPVKSLLEIEIYVL